MEAPGSAVSPQGGAGKPELMLPQNPPAAGEQWQVVVWAVRQINESGVRAKCNNIKGSRSDLKVTSEKYDHDKNSKRFKITITGFKNEQEAKLFRDKLDKEITYHGIVEKYK